MEVREARAMYGGLAEPGGDAVPVGYKQAGIGVIPVDWSDATIDSMALVTSGKRLPLGTRLTERATSHPYIRVTDMRPGTVSLADLRYVPDEVFPAIKNYRIFEEDIFISVAGTLGIVGKVPHELDGANLTENADRITSITCSRDYLLHVLASPYIQGTIEELRTVGAQPKLALTRICKFQIPLPPTQVEQEAIADALSDADALIESLEQLIAKKRQVKQGTMQALLIGKQRLPGFSESWAEVPIGEVADVKTGPFGSALHESDYVQSGTPIITVEHLGEFGITRQNLPLVSNKDVKRLSAYALEAGDIVFSRVGSIDRNALVSEDESGWLFSGRLLRVRVDISRVFAPYLSFQFHTEHFRNLVLAVAVGQTMASLNTKILKDILVVLPALSEQIAIANMLTDMDNELVELETRLAKTRQLKQGMMQELLTGRIRLV